MRAIVTTLMDKGIVRASRAMPVEGELQTHVDEQHRLVARLMVSPSDPRMIVAGLAHVAITEIDAQRLTLHGFERTDDGRIVAQVWECELPRRR